MDEALNKIGKVMAWATVGAIGLVTTAVAIALIFKPQITSNTPWYTTFEHPNLWVVCSLGLAAMLPLWAMAFCMMDTDRVRLVDGKRRHKEPMDFVDIMLEDRDRREKRF